MPPFPYRLASRGPSAGRYDKLGYEGGYETGAPVLELDGSQEIVVINGTNGDQQILNAQKPGPFKINGLCPRDY
jgi:hypothetical protein